MPRLETNPVLAWLHGNAVLAGVLLVDLDVPRLDGSLPPWRLEYSRPWAASRRTLGRSSR